MNYDTLITAIAAAHGPALASADAPRCFSVRLPFLLPHALS
jgi:hypothetical protein